VFHIVLHTYRRIIKTRTPITRKITQPSVFGYTRCKYGSSWCGVAMFNLMSPSFGLDLLLLTALLLFTTCHYFLHCLFVWIIPVFRLFVYIQIRRTTCLHSLQEMHQINIWRNRVRLYVSPHESSNLPLSMLSKTPLVCLQINSNVIK
jgi:hypothetical protein